MSKADSKERGTPRSDELQRVHAMRGLGCMDRLQEFRALAFSLERECAQAREFVIEFAFNKHRFTDGSSTGLVCKECGTVGSDGRIAVIHSESCMVGKFLSSHKGEVT